MIDETKIMLSEPELKIVQDSEQILTKHRIIQCVYKLYNIQVNNIKQVLHGIDLGLFSGIIESAPKISKGENYLQFPFVMLDYPAVFGKDIFALRTMFWWGNFFSVTLHLSGKYKDHFAAKIINKFPEAAKDLFICINHEQWHHHFQPSNYVPVEGLTKDTLNEIINGQEFLKIAMKYELHQWNEMNRQLPIAYMKIMKLVNA